MIDRKELFEYLDSFTFVNDTEVYCAICDYIEEQEGVLYWSDCGLASELAIQYEQARNIEHFNI